MQSRSSQWLHVSVLTLLAAVSLLTRNAWAVDVLTQHYNNARTGATLTETTLNTATVSSGNFGKLWTLYADGQIVAQPLYVSALQINTAGNAGAAPVQGTFNAVIVATMHNTVYVYKADEENRGPDGRTIPLWATWLGEPRPGTKRIDMWSTNDPEWGILGTPVISDDKQTLFVVAWHQDALNQLRYRLHALNMQNGTHRGQPVIIGATCDPTQNIQGQQPFSACLHKQRAALLLNQGNIYVGFGGDGSRGAMFVFDANTLAQKAFWNSTPTGGDGGIWQSGQGPAADADGNVYLITGNGAFNGNTANGKNFGSSFVKLKLQGQQVVVKDFFTPCNFQFLNNLDLDLGSAGPLLINDAPARVISGGKEGVLYVLSQTQMGKFVASPTAPNCTNANAIQQVLAFGAHEMNGQTHYGNIHGSPVYWKGPDTGRIYAWGENSPLRAFKYEGGQLQDVANAKVSAFTPPAGMPGGMLALSADGSKAGSGILWAMVPLDGDANQQRGVKGIVLALDAQDVTRTLWTSEQFGNRDRMGLYAKFNPPMVANGKVFVATYGDDEERRVYPPNPELHPTAPPPNYYVAVYGMMNQPPPMQHQTVNQDRDDVTVLKAETELLTLQTNQCQPIDTASVDCTAAISQAVGAPALHRIVLAANQPVTGCALVRVTTVSKTAAAANSKGIGFWSAAAAAGNQAPENSGLFITPAKLKVVGTATLKNGAPATLHEFIGVSNCPLGANDSMSRLFKPYMQFEGDDGTVFRNWDLAENYRISRNILKFDRSKTVLKR
jgi:outer membrane protein assembly factor BamB